MNLDIDHVIRIFFYLKNELLYRLGLDGISACPSSSTLNQSPSVPYQYINKLPISTLKFVHYAYDNFYSVLHGIWAFVQNKGCCQKISFSCAIYIYIQMLNVDRISKD